MAKDFKVKDGEQIRTRLCTVATNTVIEAGDLVEFSSGVIIKATATAAAVGYCPNGSAKGEVLTEVSVGNDFTLLGTGDAAFAVTQKGTKVDLVVTSGAQLIDVGATTYQILQICGAADSGTVGSASDIEVRINKPLF